MPRPTRTLRWREPRGGRSVSRLNRLRVSFLTLLAVRLDFFLTIFLAINLVHHFHEVPNFVDHAASFWRVLTFDHLMQTAQPKPANRLPHIIGAADKADHPLDFDRAAGRRVFLGTQFVRTHCASPAATFSDFFSRPVISSTVLVRVSATCAASFKPSNAENVALTTLCGFEVPSDLVSTL